LVGGFASFWDPEKYKRLPEGRTARIYEPDNFYATDAITDYALDFIDAAKAKDKPLFLYLAYNAPHFPLQAPKEETDKYFEYYKQGWDYVRKERFNRMKKMGILENDFRLSPRGDVPESQFNSSTYSIPAWTSLSEDQQLDLARRMAIYAGMVDRMDQNIGRVLNKLEEEDQLDNTLIIFLSDNGGCAEWTENGFDKRSGLFYKIHTGKELDEMGLAGTYHHYGTGWANVSNTLFKSYKHYAYEGGISSPTILHWPDRIKRKSEIDYRPAHITDIIATCIKTAGATYPQEFNGHSVLPLEGQSLIAAIKGEPATERVICIEHEGNRMVRKGDWKLVSANYKDNRWELYNIKEDRTERIDLSGKYPGKVKSLSDIYKA
jgi:arylsulfatase A-like enzyme